MVAKGTTPEGTGALASAPPGATLLEDENDVLGIDDIGSEWVTVPEWAPAGKPLTLLVVGMTGKERDAWEDSRTVEKRNRKGRVVSKVDMHNLRASLVQLSVRKPSDPRERVFRLESVDRLGNQSAAALERVFDVARTLSGLTDQDIEELTDELKDGPSGEPG